MNIHLFVIFGKNAENSPLAKALRAQGINLEIFSEEVRLNFSNKMFRYIVGWPSLLWFSARSVYRSLKNKPAAEVVIVNSHFDVLVFSIIGFVSRKKIPHIVLPGFIYTENSPWFIRRLKKSYFNWILSSVSVAICHSKLEVKSNQKRFSPLPIKFIFFPYAIHVSDATGFNANTLQSNILLSAGRSGRDYALLIKSVKNLDIIVHIVCDYFSFEALQDLPANIQIIKGCYGECYFNELAACRFVVIPLRVMDISAGQMVLLQAMAMGKPVIITRTPTTVDYLKDGDGVIFVEHGNQQELTESIHRLIDDDDFCAHLGKRGAELFSEKFSIRAYANNLLSASKIACLGDVEKLD